MSNKAELHSVVNQKSVESSEDQELPEGKLSSDQQYQVDQTALSALESVPSEAFKIQERLSELHLLARMTRIEIETFAENYKKLSDAMSFKPDSGKSLGATKVQNVAGVLSVGASDKEVNHFFDESVKTIHNIAEIELQQRNTIAVLDKKLSDLEDDLRYKNLEVRTSSGIFAFLKNKGTERKVRAIEKDISDLKVEIDVANLHLRENLNKKERIHHSAKLALGQVVNQKREKLEKKYTEMLGTTPELQKMNDRCADIYILDKAKQYEPERVPEIVSALPDFHKVDHELKRYYRVESDLGKIQVISGGLRDAISLVEHSRPQNELPEKILRFDFENQMEGLRNPKPNQENPPSEFPEWNRNHARLDSGDIDMWRLVRKDSGFIQAFGNVLEQYDDWNRKGATESAVRNVKASDSDEISILKHFPDQEVLNVLISTMLGTGPSRVKAEKIVHQIFKDPEWEDTISESLYGSLKNYPEFTVFFEYLKNEPYGIEHAKVVDLRDTSNYSIDRLNEFIEQIQSSGHSIDENRLEMMLDSLGTAKLIEKAIEMGVLDPKEGKSICEALEVIDEKIEIKYIQWYKFTRDLREYMKKLFLDTFSKKEPVEQQTSGEEKEEFDKEVLVSLSKEIALCKEEKYRDKLLALLGESILHVKSIASNVELLRIISGDMPKYMVLNKLMPFDLNSFFLKPEHFTVEWLDYMAELLKENRYSKEYVATVLTEIAHGHITAQRFEVCTEKYGKNISSLHVAIDQLKNGLSADIIEQMPVKMPAVINTDDEKSQKVLNFICEKHEVFLDTASSMEFCNRIVGLYGNQAESILRGYVECVDGGVVSKRDMPLVLEFLEHFRIVSPAILSGYIESKKTHQEDVYLAELNSSAESMISVKTMSEADRAKPYFNDLIKHVYPKNSSNFGSHEGAVQCKDRSSDLEGYVIKPKYEIDLLNSGEIILKDGEALSEANSNTATGPIYAIHRKFESVAFDSKKMIQLVESELHQEFPQIDPSLSLEEKIFRAMAESLYGDDSDLLGKVKQIVLGYEFALHEDVREYIAGTGDRVSHASNKEYAELCELNAFYTDRIKDVTRMLTEKAYQSGDVQQLMADYFKSLTNKKTSMGRKDRINKLQVNKLGLSDGFLSQIKRTLEQRSGRKYTDVQTKRIIRLYEKLTVGSEKNESTSANKGTKAVYGQLKSQRSKTMAAIVELTGKEIQPEELFLGDMDMSQLLDSERSIQTGTYNEDQFAAYTVEKSIGLFGKEQKAISSELSKFVSTTGNTRKVLNAVITKSKESACARMTGGVCVAGDNPDNRGGKNQWDQENYFQMVFQDPESLICQGLVLLHADEVDGKKVLCASFNPSSTYLYTVDEKSLYKGIVSQLGSFAQDNGFAEIAVSANKNIRTNRVGGGFETAMDESISGQGKKFKFEISRAFSYKPSYLMSDMDVIWTASSSSK